MRRYVIAGAALGFLGGLFVHSVIAVPSFSPGELLIAIVTISVGWWIDRTLHRQEELDRIPINTVSKLCDRLDGLIVQCIEAAPFASPTDPGLVQPLRFLANEITWLGTVVAALGTGNSEYGRLSDQAHVFKVLLTYGPDVQAIAAAEVGRSMRGRCLQIRWQLSKHILDRPGELAAFGGSK